MSTKERGCTRSSWTATTRTAGASLYVKKVFVVSTARSSRWLLLLLLETNHLLPRIAIGASTRLLAKDRCSFYTPSAP
ncbi:hypothetical protein OH76DRAFT_1407434 [Lentinus brumalis]|uniref:Uncharacterized protein n=1 Tax=Lentinus brumalis TaxID=2498619 RepID=A0A371D0L1_9APHY|nr:hypothetical protein OH76DRAFT_1407434 [Polyporus brumalis]